MKPFKEEFWTRIRKLDNGMKPWGKRNEEQDNEENNDDEVNPNEKRNEEFWTRNGKRNDEFWTRYRRWLLE